MINWKNKQNITNKQNTTKQQWDRHEYITLWMTAAYKQGMCIAMVNVLLGWLMQKRQGKNPALRDLEGNNYGKTTAKWETNFTPSGASNSSPVPLFGLCSKEQDLRWTQTSCVEEDPPHSFLKTSIYSCRPKRKHCLLLTAKHQQGIFLVLMNKMIILWRKKLAQFFSILSFLPHMAQATLAYGPSSCYQVSPL